MALRVCLGCGCKYAVGLPACPQCWGTESEEDGVAKITVSGGPSLHTDGGAEEAPPSAETAPAALAAAPPPAVAPVPAAAPVAAPASPVAG